MRRANSAAPASTIGRRFVRRSFVGCVVVLALIFASATVAARNPIATERSAIQQAIFDFVATNAKVKDPRILAIRVSTRIPPPPRDRTVRFYSSFARIDLDDPSGGLTYALVGYFVTGRLSGWRVLDLGSAEVGCFLPAAVFRGEKRAVLRDLRMSCPP